MKSLSNNTKHTSQQVFKRVLNLLGQQQSIHLPLRCHNLEAAIMCSLNQFPFCLDQTLPQSKARLPSHAGQITEYYWFPEEEDIFS